MYFDKHSRNTQSRNALRIENRCFRPFNITNHCSAVPFQHALQSIRRAFAFDDNALPDSILPGQVCRKLTSIVIDVKCNDINTWTTPRKSYSIVPLCTSDIDYASQSSRCQLLYNRR